MLHQVTNNKKHFGFVLAQTSFGTGAAPLAKVLSLASLSGGVFVKYLAHPKEVVLTLVWVGRKFERLLRLAARVPIGDLFDGFQVRSRSDHRVAAFVLEIEVDASHDYTEGPRDNGVARFVKCGSFLVIAVPGHASASARRAVSVIRRRVTSMGCLPARTRSAVGELYT